MASVEELHPTLDPATIWTFSVNTRRRLLFCDECNRKIGMAKRYYYQPSSTSAICLCEPCFRKRGQKARGW